MKHASWQTRLQSVLRKQRRRAGSAPNYPAANSDLINWSLGGITAEGTKTESPGRRIVVNISSAHIPNFFADGRYKNAYELKISPRIGKAPTVSAKRQIVDTALQAATGLDPRTIYFAAVELNGAGISFYGDYCLVLKGRLNDDHLIVLDRNSYDLIRDPLRSKIDRSRAPDASRTQVAKSLCGSLKTDLAAMAAIKVLSGQSSENRLLTTSMISNGILDDEDYIEVLRPESFGPTDLAEVRLSAPDVTVDERIRSRGLAGLPPSHSELLWRRRRRIAEAHLADAGISIRIITLLGRTRG